VDRLFCGLAAVTWSIHPLRAEVVAWPSAQPYTLCASFLLLSALAYTRFMRSSGPSIASLAASLGLYVAAALSKSIAIPFPALLLAINALYLREGYLGARVKPLLWKALASAIVFGLIAAAMVSTTLLANRSGSARDSDVFYFASGWQRVHKALHTMIMSVSSLARITCRKASESALPSGMYG
jgi:hypothetical protein